MRITILTNRDVHSNIAVNLLLPRLAKHDLTIFVSENVGRPAPNYRPPAAFAELMLIERELFSHVLSPLAELQADTSSRCLTFNELGERTGHPVQVLSSINLAKGFHMYSESKPEVVISIRFGSILRDKAINVPPLGVLNLHSGLLPRYQGILTTLHSLIEDQNEVGCTLHYIDSRSIDAGPIIDTARVTVEPNQSLLWHVVQLYPLGCAMIADAVDELAAGDCLPASAQDTSQQRYYSLPDEHHFQQLGAKGFRVWTPADVLSLYSRFVCGRPKGGRRPGVIG